MSNDDAIETLLERAAPRPVPPEHVETDVRAAVHAAWRSTVGGRRRRRTIAGLAVAATLLLAVATTFDALRNSGTAATLVATIDKSHGSIMIEGARSGQVPADDLTMIVTGQTLLSAADAAAGLAWENGGSLRIDRNSRVEFVSGNEIFLHSGRVYFDSAPAQAGTEFVVLTAHGRVTHVGTQFMAESRPASLVVSVREGEVAVSGTFHDETARKGQVIELTGSASASRTNTSGVGNDWQWIEAVAPHVDMNGRSTYEFLLWVGRETGHEVRFVTESAEQLARDTDFVGDIESDPRSELRLRMMTTDLEARFESDEPAILVTDSR